MSILRVDDIVQDSQGRALSGAMVWYCTQPAVVADPPSPLATVYSNLTGTVQPQPLITDGYGHVAVYLDNGQLYTLVTFHPLTGLLAYPDQNAGSSAQTILFKSQNFTGQINGSQAVFTLSSAPTTVFLNVVLNGLTLLNGLGYTISGATVTLASPPQIGDSLYAVWA